MKRIKIFFSWALLLASSLQAQQSVFHFYDPKNLSDIHGLVQGIDYENLYGKKSQFLMLTILSDDRRLFRVEVCPQWFFASDIAVGMKIRIQGSLLEGSEGDAYLIAREISLQGERIALRDRRGFPMWSQHGSMDGSGNRKGPGRRGKR